MYKVRGFNIDVYHGDNEFNKNDFWRHTSMQKFQRIRGS